MLDPKIPACIIFYIGTVFAYLPAFAQTQYEVNTKTCNEYESADQKLNAVYRQILEKYKSDTAFIAKLKTAQRAWLAFRDAELAAIYPADDKQAEYGSVYLMCSCIELATLTNQRIEQLSGWLLTAKEGDICRGSR